MTQFSFYLLVYTCACALSLYLDVNEALLSLHSFIHLLVVYLSSVFAPSSFTSFLLLLFGPLSAIHPRPVLVY
ncbi:hypothetical protein CPB84DRAFT_1763377 [Gymnopilus junonius]|uniref:Uncharacterized protein n=1 Tax=Gymnopilus junonius TaxID=109634 RepID=A0A9P5NYQ3_GYMJU|nr:hypothetical protein CPB84DRAFT_1763377 [Gymnopilus junonius]